MKVYLKKLYQNLKGKYRRPAGQWKLWCKRPKTKKERERVIIEAILTQRTNWKNVELVMENLKKKNLVSLKKILNLGPKRLENEIKSSGFYKTKAKYLISLARFILENYGNINKLMKAKKEELREKMLKLKGIGKETADSILLYGLDKPIFVIDEYTRRLIKKEKLTKNFSYNFLQKLFQENLKKDFRLYQDFHALIVIDGKNKK
jgi:endonuclease-3 related protein